MKTLQAQRGATLIIVLFVLLLITIIGVISVRQSMTNLDVSTADQVNKVLFQAGDAALMKIEKQDRLDDKIQDAGATLRGKVVDVPVGQQIVFCLRPRQANLFTLKEYTQRLSSAKDKSGLTFNSTNGFCDADKSDDYISPNRVITQVYIANEPRPAEAETFSGESKLTGSDDLDLTTTGRGGIAIVNNFKIYTVSVLPAFANAPLGDKESIGTDTVSGCFKQTINAATNNVDSCLQALDVPYHVQVQEYKSESKNIPSV